MTDSKRLSSVALVSAALILYLIIVSSAASASVEQWNMTFGGSDDECARSVRQTSDGGYIIAGYTKSYGAGGFDGWLIKTDGNGNKKWSKTFGGEDWDDFYSVQQTSDNGYIIAGVTRPYVGSWNDAWLVKTDKNGNRQWSKIFGGSDEDYAYSVQQTIDGGYILAGATPSYGAGGSDAWLIKTDNNGNEMWNKTFGGTNWDYANSVKQTSDGGYILAGHTRSYGAGQEDFWLIKTDSNGNEMWNKTFGDTAGDFAYSVQQTVDGGYIIAGDTWSYGAGNDDAWLIKTDSSGNKKWSKTFGGPSFDAAYSVQQTSDKGYIMAGTTWSYDKYNWEDAWLIKTDSNGNEKWNQTFGGSSWERAYSVQQTSNGGYILAGITSSYGAGGTDAWSIKVAPVIDKPPVANFAAKPTSGKAPLTVAFTDTSTEKPTKWKWTFGDGTNSTKQNPTHKYSKAGNYTISLTVTNAAGSNTLTKSNFIKVTSSTPKPVAAFSASPTSGKAPLKVQFTDKSTGSPTSWKWSFGDGSTSTSKSPAYTYKKAGKYTVSLTVKNAAGSNTKTIKDYITVTTTVKPVAAFSASPTSGKAPLKVQFTDKSTGSPTSWKWSFGDGKTSTSRSPAYTYKKAGKYTVSLTVKNAAGSNTKTMSGYIKVS